MENNGQGAAPQGDGRPRKSKKHFFRRRRYHKQDERPQVSTTRSNFRKVSVVVPLFNEEESLPHLASELKKAFTQLNIAYEVFFIDDGSTDQSLSRIKEICRQDRRFKFVSFQKNYGKSAALQVGFEQVTGDVVVTMDADLQDDPAEIQNLIKKLEEGFDLVSGWKKKRHDPFIKRHSSKFFNFVTGLMSGIKIHDFNCGLKAYRRVVTDNIRVYGELHRYMPVLAHWLGFTVSEIAVQHHPRRFGKTKFGVSRFFKGFVDLVTVTFITRYVQRPMHLFGFLGAIAFIMGIIVNGFLTVEWFQGKPLSNRPMLFFGILLIIVGVQFFSTGLLGELMVHNFQDRKSYAIKDMSQTPERQP
ncbi:MAG: glycosyltransferase [Ignavibacteriaceae bacterium]|nr:glycosyltransferase [Ignavibacteriaceae bacterium]